MYLIFKKKHSRKSKMRKILILMLFAGVSKKHVFLNVKNCNGNGFFHWENP